MEKSFLLIQPENKGILQNLHKHLQGKLNRNTTHFVLSRNTSYRAVYMMNLVIGYGWSKPVATELFFMGVTMHETRTHGIMVRAQ